MLHLFCFLPLLGFDPILHGLFSFMLMGPHDFSGLLRHLLPSSSFSSLISLCSPSSALIFSCSSPVLVPLQTFVLIPLGSSVFVSLGFSSSVLLTPGSSPSSSFQAHPPPSSFLQARIFRLFFHPHLFRLILYRCLFGLYRKRTQHNWNMGFSWSSCTRSPSIYFRTEYIIFNFL